MTMIQTAVLLIAGVACVWDLRTRRIPNVLTFGATAGALGFHMASNGVDGAMTSLGGWAVGVAVLFAPYALGGNT